MHWCLKQTTVAITSGSIPYLWGAHLYNFDPPSEILDPPLGHGSNDIEEKNATKKSAIEESERKKQKPGADSGFYEGRC